MPVPRHRRAAQSAVYRGSRAGCLYVGASAPSECRRRLGTGAGRVQGWKEEKRLSTLPTDLRAGAGHGFECTIRVSHTGLGVGVRTPESTPASRDAKGSERAGRTVESKFWRACSSSRVAHGAGGVSAGVEANACQARGGLGVSHAGSGTQSRRPVRHLFDALLRNRSTFMAHLDSRHIH